MKSQSLIESIRKVKYFNQWIIFFIDLSISCISTLIAMGMLGYVFKPDYQDDTVLYLVMLSAMGSMIGFFCGKTYKGIIRHSSFMEAGRIAGVVLLKICLILPLAGYVIKELPHPTIWLGAFVDLVLTFFLLILFRALLITMYRLVLNTEISNRDRMLIFGSESPATAFWGASMHRKLRYQVDGYLRIGQKDSLRMAGYKVYSVRNQAEFNRLINRRNIKAIFFTEYRAVKEESERLIRYCEKKKVRMFLLPSIDELKANNFSICNLPEVRVEDLLGREEIKINTREVAESLENQVVMVTGAAGSIGSELCRQLASFGVKELILFDSAETPMHNIRLELEEKFPQIKIYPIVGDVRMSSRLENVFRRFHPQLIFHAAAYKHVPLMEENPCEAIRTNVYGTCNVADMAVAYGVDKFIMISTDKAVNPTNVMGASKRLAEVYVQSLGTAIRQKNHSGHTLFITTRFGNVLGSNGSVIPRFREQLSKGGPLTVTHRDIIRYFMTIPEACRLVLEAAFMGKGEEIFVFDMGKPVKIADLAERMIELAGLVPGEDIQIEYTGLRPGEKLYEELLARNENTIPTTNQKIFRAKVREYKYDEILPYIVHLTDVAASMDKMETVRKMKQILPEFKSQHSEYEILDQ